MIIPSGELPNQHTTHTFCIFTQISAFKRLRRVTRRRAGEAKPQALGGARTGKTWLRSQHKTSCTLTEESATKHGQHSGRSQNQGSCMEDRSCRYSSSPQSQSSCTESSSCFTRLSGRRPAAIARTRSTNAFVTLYNMTMFNLVMGDKSLRGFLLLSLRMVTLHERVPLHIFASPTARRLE